MDAMLTAAPGPDPTAAGAPARRDGTTSPLPAAIVAGLTLLGGAFALDVAAHSTGLTSVEPVAHVAGVLGMVLTWIAVVIDGLRSPARRA